MTTKPKLKIVYKNLIDLKDATYNPRKITEKQLEEIRLSVRKFGMVENIVVNTYKGREGVIVGGHRRREILMLEGDKTGPCVEVCLNKEDERELNIRLNKNSGEFDDELLQDYFDKSELQQWGFDDFELNGMFVESDIRNNEEDDEGDDGENGDGENTTNKEEPPEIEEDKIGILLDKWNVKEGQIWKLGKHRLMCGDATKNEDVDKLMQGVKADMVFTNPPYNTGMTAKTQSSVSGGTLWKGNKKCERGKPRVRLSQMFNDSYTDDEWQKFMHDFCEQYDRIAKDNTFIFVCLDWRRSYELIPHLKERWKLSNLIVWDKVVHGLGSDYKYVHEFIHVCKKGKPELARNKDGDREYYDIWHIQRKMGGDDDHATKNPLELCERPIRHTTHYNDVVADLFGGSGSTLLSCERNNRICYTMELDPKYCAVILERYKNETQEEPELVEGYSLD